MKVVPFIAENPAAALAQIHEQLGPEAIVVSVRPLPRQGLARFWPKTGPVEVLACVAEAEQSDSDLGRPFAGSATVPAGCARSLVAPARGQRPIQALHDGSQRPHVFIGPPGTGKTTLLCKWMTLCVLTENRAARVWRLDGVSANTAEFINIYAEMLGLGLERFWTPPLGIQPVEQPGETGPSEPARRASTIEGGGDKKGDLLLVDLPGVQAGDTQGLSALRDLLASLPSPRLHLVLNAAYETPILSEQFRAFALFSPEDVSLTHLDEEQRQGKLLDFILGTNCSLRFLSTGQKIPGDLVIAEAESRVRPGFDGDISPNKGRAPEEGFVAKHVLNPN